MLGEMCITDESKNRFIVGDCVKIFFDNEDGEYEEDHGTILRIGEESVLYEDSDGETHMLFLENVKHIDIYIDMNEPEEKEDENI